MNIKSSINCYNKFSNTSSGEIPHLHILYPPLPTTQKTPYNYCSSGRIDPRDGSLDSGGEGEKLATPQPDLATLLQKTGNTVIF